MDTIVNILLKNYYADHHGKNNIRPQKLITWALSKKILLIKKKKTPGNVKHLRQHCDR